MVFGYVTGMSYEETVESLREVSPAILPSLLNCDFGHLAEEIERLESAGVSALHLDVMDGVFVPNFSFGMTIVEAINRLTDLPLDVHLMMVHPENYIRHFADAGADVLTVHAEAVEDSAGVLEMIHQHGMAAGIAINPDTPVSAIKDALTVADLVLVMSVNAGFGGQAFDASVIEKLGEIRSLPGGEDVLLEMDGGINAGTIGQVTAAGCQLMVAGSAIVKTPDYQKAIADMMSEVVTS